MKSLLYLTLGALLACPIVAYAQTSTNAAPPGPPPGGGWRHHDPLAGLTDAEKTEYETDRKAALTANPTLATQMKNVMDQMKQARDSGEKPSEDLMGQMKSLHEQLDQAMIKLDASVAPIVAKVDAHHHHGGPEGGAPPPPPADSGT
jgi:Spy/CpxP family protein refolding chaperone